MTIEINAPTFPESVADGTIATWHKQAGEPVKRDDLIVDIETDKVVLEIVAPMDGTIGEIIKVEGDVVLSNELIATFVAGELESAATVTKAEPAASAAAAASPAELKLSPAARKLIEENSLDAKAIVATGKGALVTKEDVLNHLRNQRGGITAAKESPKAQPAPSAAVTVYRSGEVEAKGRGRDRGRARGGQGCGQIGGGDALGMGRGVPGIRARAGAGLSESRRSQPVA